jgi:hypothetical protein
MDGAWCGLVESLATEMRAGAAWALCSTGRELPDHGYANLDDYGHLRMGASNTQSYTSSNKKRGGAGIL